MTDRSELLQHVAALAANFNREADDAMFLAFECGLSDLPVADVKQAIGRAIRECKFMPTVAELRGLAGVMLPADRAILAWDAFVNAVITHGYYASVDFDDRIINATVRSLGGWEACCEKSGDEFDKWLRKDFERVYAAFMRTGVGSEASAPLIGFINRTNSFNGHMEHVKEPLLITTGLPPHREGLVQLPGTRSRDQKLLAELAVGVGRLAEPREPQKA